MVQKILKLRQTLLHTNQTDFLYCAIISLTTKVVLQDFCFSVLTVTKDKPIMLLFYLLCYATVLLKYSISSRTRIVAIDCCYVIYIQFCMSISLHVTESLYKDCLLDLEYIDDRYQVAIALCSIIIL